MVTQNNPTCSHRQQLVIPSIPCMKIHYRDDAAKCALPIEEINESLFGQKESFRLLLSRHIYMRSANTACAHCETLANTTAQHAVTPQDSQNHHVRWEQWEIAVFETGEKGDENPRLQLLLAATKSLHSNHSLPYPKSQQRTNPLHFSHDKLAAGEEKIPYVEG